MEVNCTLSSYYLNSIAEYVIKLAFISFLLLKMFLSASTEDFLCISLNTFLYWDFSSKFANSDPSLMQLFHVGHWGV